MNVDIGIIGLGGIGTHHAERLPDDTLAGGVDHCGHTREQFAKRFGVPTYEDAQHLYDECDAVIVCVPNRYHEQYATTAMYNNVHVLVEKPLAHDIESAERIANAAEMSDTTCMVGFNNRYSTAASEAAVAVAEGELGRVTHVEANYVRRSHVPRGWFTDPSVSGGGVLLDLGVHAIDLGMHILGYPSVSDVSGSAHSVHDCSPVEDISHAYVQTDGGTTLSVNTAWGAPVESYDVRVFGTDGIEEFDMLNGSVDTYRSEQRMFASAIHHGESGNVHEALEVQRIVDDIYTGDGVEDPVAVDITEVDHA